MKENFFDIIDDLRAYEIIGTAYTGCIRELNEEAHYPVVFKMRRKGLIAYLGEYWVITDKGHSDYRKKLKKIKEYVADHQKIFFPKDKKEQNSSDVG